MLATLLVPSSGSILIGGINPEEEPREVRKLIGYMPDFFGVYPDLAVWEYLDFFLEPLITFLNRADHQ